MELKDLKQLEKEIKEEQQNNKVTSLNKGKLRKNNDGTVSKSRNNLILMFRGADPKLDKLFKYNEATKNIEVTRDQELTEYITLKKGLLSDSVINQLWAYISEEYGLEYKENELHYQPKPIEEESDFDNQSNEMAQYQELAKEVEDSDKEARGIAYDDTIHEYIDKRTEQLKEKATFEELIIKVALYLKILYNRN